MSNYTANVNVKKTEKVPKRRGLNANEPVDYFMIAILSLCGLLRIDPFYNVIVISIVPQIDYIRNPFILIPKRLTNESYVFVFQSKLLLTSIRNSVGITIIGTIYNIILTTLMAYALTRPFPGRRFIRFVLVFTMYFNGGLIPTYLLIRNLGLQNTYASMVLPTVVTVSYTMLIFNYFRSLPEELFDAASIDGANELRILYAIILPLSQPIIATFTVYYAVERWNEWYYAMLYLRSIDKWPLQLALRQLITDASFVNQASGTEGSVPVSYAEGIKMAAIVITMSPIMAVYPFFQRFFLSGLTVGAVKG